MKNLKEFSLIVLGMLFLASCAKSVKETPVSLQSGRPDPSVYNQVMRQIAAQDAASDQSGLTTLIFGRDNGHTWQEVDTYYQKVDALPYNAEVKQALKEKAIFGLVEIYHFLDKAPLEKRTYYADQFFGQRTIDAKLALPFLENLRGEWPAEKLAAAKTKTSQKLQADLARATKKAPSDITLPNTEEAQHALASLEKTQAKRAQQVYALQERLAALP